MKHLLLSLGLLLALPAFAKGVEVRFPGPGLELVGRLYLPQAAKGHAPAIVYAWLQRHVGRDGNRQEHAAWAEHFRQARPSLMVDSFGPRPDEIAPSRTARSCSAATAGCLGCAALACRPRRCRPQERPRIGVVPGSMCWSLRANRLASADGPRFDLRLLPAVRLGCIVTLIAPLLIQTGAADDRCRRAVRGAAEARAKARRRANRRLPDAHHAFDGVEGSPFAPERGNRLISRAGARPSAPPGSARESLEAGDRVHRGPPFHGTFVGPKPDSSRYLRPPMPAAFSIHRA